LIVFIGSASLSVSWAPFLFNQFNQFNQSDQLNALLPFAFRRPPFAVSLFLILSSAAAFHKFFTEKFIRRL